MTDYDELTRMTDALIRTEGSAKSKWMNVLAIIMETIPDLSWVGFYLARNDRLELDAFQGRPACMTIAFDAGVCGAAFSQEKTLIVPDVHAFPGHIACDERTMSEMVIPLKRDGCVIGVLDLDSLKLDRFDEGLAAKLERVMEKLMETIGGIV